MMRRNFLVDTSYRDYRRKTGGKRVVDQTVFSQMQPDILPFISNKKFFKSLNVAEFRSN